MHILIVEDDEQIAENIAIILKSSGYQSSIASDGTDGLHLLTNESYDAVILDWMLPDNDGINLCKELRKKSNAIPILMLTARAQMEDKVEGLLSGADDYLTKPFAKEELIARIQALIRRSSSAQGSPIIKIADLTIDVNKMEVKRAGKVISLAPREYALLEYLVMHKGVVVDRVKLLHHVWGEDVDMFSNTVDVHIRYLRQKVDTGYKISLIKTVKNKGYMICED